MERRKPLTPYQRHVKHWGGGCGSEQCDRACKVVLARGKVPSDITFVGEAPGISEDVLGKPFVGPAGILLDSIIESAVPARLRVSFTNLVGCIPLADEGGKLSEPEDDQVLACQERLVEFLDYVAKPRLVVLVGKQPKDWFDPMYRSRVKLQTKPYVVSMRHPAFLLRQPTHLQTPLVRREKLTLIDAVTRFFPEED